MADAAWTLNHGIEFPYHGKPPKDVAERAALGVLSDLCDRKGIKWELDAVDEDSGLRDEIVESLAAIIRAAYAGDRDD